MNKPKYQMTNRDRKKMKKEVRMSSIEPDPELKSDHIKPNNLLSRLPKKVQKQERASLKSFDKNIAVKRKKQHARHSKRTTPGTVDVQSSPHIVHVEGKRWIKTLEKQNQVKKTVLRRQALKKKGR